MFACMTSLALSLVMGTAIGAHHDAGHKGGPEDMAPTGRITLTIGGITPGGGRVVADLSNNRNDWETPSWSFKQAFAEPTSTTATIVFDELPYGPYAVRVFQDRNDDRRLDTNLLGWVQEPFGESQTSQPGRSGADWDAAKFELASAEHAVEITLRGND